MYLRTTKRKNSDGTVVTYYQLAENDWDAAKGCSVARVVYSFGRADALDCAFLKLPTNSFFLVSTDRNGTPRFKHRVAEALMNSNCAFRSLC